MLAVSALLNKNMRNNDLSFAGGGCVSVGGTAREIFVALIIARKNSQK